MAIWTEEKKPEVRKARYLLSDNETLSKKTFDWETPAHLRLLAKKYNKIFIGLGHWGNTDKKYLCMATPHGDFLIYINRELLKKLTQAMNLDGIEYVKEGD